MTRVPAETLPIRIGRYEIRRELGHGMMGVVYEAWDPALGRSIALKTIQLAFPLTAQERETFEQRFLAEARTAARLSHPGIVIVHDVGRDPETGTLYIALEHLKGRTLAAIIKEGPPWDWRDALRTLGRVAEALHHAHSQGVLHRDIKPANIMVLPSGEPKIMDFGIAKIETARIKLTIAGQFFGTPLYMSPEQALGQKLDARTDLFSVGAIAYTLLTGKLAFGAENVMKIIRRVVAEDPPPPSQLVRDLPVEVDYLLARSLAKSPTDRYTDGKAMAEDIEDILAGRTPRHLAGWIRPLRAENMLATDALAPVPSEPDLELVLLEDATRKSSPAVDLETQIDSLLSGAVSAAPVLPSPGAQPGGLRAPEATRAPTAAARSEPSAMPRRGVALAGRAANRPSPRALAILTATIMLAVPIAFLAHPEWGPRAIPPVQAPPFAQPSSPRPQGAPLPAPPAVTTPSSAPLPAVPPAASADAGQTPVSPQGSPATAFSAPPASPVAPPPAEPGTATTRARVVQPTLAPAQLAFDFEHFLKAGTLRIWVDDRLVVEEDIEGHVSKEIIGIKMRKGRVEDVLKVSPGKREVRVQVTWEDNSREERLLGTFKSGGTRHLEIRLGRLLKNLSLEWK